MKYTTATGNAVLRAYNRAAKHVKADSWIRATEQDAGFIMPDDFPKGEGYQVFVRIVRFSEAKLKKKPLTGGLLA